MELLPRWCYTPFHFCFLFLFFFLKFFHQSLLFGPYNGEQAISGIKDCHSLSFFFFFYLSKLLYQGLLLFFSASCLNKEKEELLFRVFQTLSLWRSKNLLKSKWTLNKRKGNDNLKKNLWEWHSGKWKQTRYFPIRKLLSPMLIHTYVASKTALPIAKIVPLTIWNLLESQQIKHITILTPKKIFYETMVEEKQTR